MSVAQGPATPQRLRSALMRFDEVGADRLLEESLAQRSVERTVEEVLLAGLSDLSAEADGETAEYGFAWRWATGWLAAQARLTPPASRAEGVVISTPRPRWTSTRSTARRWSSCCAARACACCR